MQATTTPAINFEIESDVAVLSLAKKILAVVREHGDRVQVSAALNIAGELWTISGREQA